MARTSLPRVGTLSDLITTRRSLVLYCRTTGCRAPGKEVDIAAVIAQHGDMQLQEFAERSRCAACGASEPQTVCAPLSTGPT